MIALLDTNVILRYLTNNSPEAAEAVAKRFGEAKAGKISLRINSFIVIETIYLLEDYYHFSREEIVSALGGLLAQPFLDLEDKDCVFAALLSYNHSIADFTDCLLHALARQNTYKILSFDKHFDKLEPNLCLEP